MPIKMTLAMANPAFPCEVIGDTPVDVWKHISDLAKVMSVKACGKCQSEDLLPETRPVEKDGKKFDGFKWRCESCGSSLIIRSTQEGKLYLKWDEKWFTPEKKDEPPI